MPQLGLVAPVDRLEDRKQFVTVGILESEPRITRFFVMGAVYLPLILDDEILLTMKQEVVGRHHSARKEIPTHPIIRAFNLEWITSISMGKMVNKKLPIMLEPSRNSRKECFVISDVLKHFDRQDSIEAARRNEVVDIGGNDFDVPEIQFSTLSENEISLGLRVGDRYYF